MKARFTPSLFAHAEAVLGQLLKFQYPADAVVSHYFRDHRGLGHADRAFVAETVFAVLRRGRSIEARCAGNLSDRRRLLVALAVVRNWTQRELAPVLQPSEEEWLAAAKAMPESEFSPAVRCDMPDWLYASLEAQFGADEVIKLADGLNQPAPLDLRANTIKISRDELLAKFAAEEVVAVAGTLSPAAIRLRGKPALAKNPMFLQGLFEVQDEGSQLLGYLLEPKRGEMVVDFCAGAGGKTLLLGALMKNTGRLYAYDVSDKRLARLKPRLARSGLSNVHPIRIEHERDTKIKRLAGKVDRVLVDAPCSGLGTLRRNPDLKWRQSEESVAELTVKQASILDSAAKMVRPGGRVVYATCSLLAAENDAIITAFLETHPEFKLTPACEVLAKQGIELAGDTLRLLPHQHHTDGFFAAVLDRQA
jgi:16S rRNA (cytosine967-C5)-methyltransferase